jgi:hypothetical protein
MEEDLAEMSIDCNYTQTNDMIKEWVEEMSID